MPLKTQLKSGDIVEIITAPDRTPHRSWLNWVATASARQHIKKYLNLKTRKKAIELGQKLWEKEARKFRLPPELHSEAALKEKLEREFKLRLHSLEDFYLLAGLGRVMIDRSFMERLTTGGPPREAQPTGLLKKVVERLAGRAAAPALAIKDLEEQMLTLARCCAPIKGEPVVGYLTSGKGLTVHAQRCYLVQKEILDSQRLVEVAWDPAFQGTFKARLVIRAKDAPGVLARVAAAVAEQNGNISRAEVNTSGDGRAGISLEITIKDINHLQKIMDKIKRLKEIEAVDRD